MNFIIKVADFGLAESIDSSKLYFRQDKDDIVRLPMKWLAPECINEGVFSEKSDVVMIFLFQLPDLYLVLGGLFMSLVHLANIHRLFHWKSLLLFCSSV